MSRCFPYPPPGRERDLTQYNSGRMMESLKLEKVKKDKKERKERRRDKKEKEKARGSGETDKKKHKKDRRRDKEKRHQDDGKGREHRKKRGNETEQLEKSSITEEHGHSVGSQNSCDSSGSTVNHKKRYRTSSSYDDLENFGGTIKFLLPSEGTKQLGSASCNLVQEGNVTARKPFKDARAEICSTSATDSMCDVRRSGGETSCRSSVASGIDSQQRETDPLPIYCRNSPCGLKFTNLFENWTPPSSSSEIPEDDDLEWLFTKKQNLNCSSKRIKAVADSSSYGSSGPWSRVCHLAELDLYALPFTVPF